MKTKSHWGLALSTFPKTMVGVAQLRHLNAGGKQGSRHELSRKGSETGKFWLIMVGMKLMDEIASDEVLDQAYEWMCDRRKEYSANNDVWDVRWRWNNIKPCLQEQLLEGNYRFDVLQRIHRQNDTIELWSALDALVLKAIAIVLTRRLSFSERCYHLLGHGGAKAAVRDVVQNLPNNPFVFRTDVMSYYASIDHDVLLNQLREHIDDPWLKMVCTRT